MVGNNNSPKLDEQTLPAVRENLYFQLDHKAPLLLDAGIRIVSNENERFTKIKA
ncbi:hypothetical protein GCM10011408_07070 [Dyella caseinilytica]|nr:hypothetical protein GCM10011408_07070 [Dyella caseinilytica]